jgi:hypothetical protein
MKPRWNEGYEPKLVHDHRNLERGGQCLRENPKEKQLPDPEGILQGSGNVARHIRLPSAGRLDELSVKKMMEEATARAAYPFSPQGTPRVIIKSISAKQRPRRPSG